MPTYEYVCPECGKSIDKHFSFDKVADARVDCECGARMDRQISGGGAVIFKGSGFYTTDHPDKKSRSNSTKNT